MGTSSGYTRFETDHIGAHRDWGGAPSEVLAVHTQTQPTTAAMSMAQTTDLWREFLTKIPSMLFCG